MVARVAHSGLTLLCLGLAGPAIAAAPMPVRCTVIGTKFFAPTVPETELCTRFVRALGAAAHLPTSLNTAAAPDGLIVELRFGPRGMASAKASRLRAGRTISLPVYELAISDRQFAPSDIDMLASDVARGLTAGMARKGKG